MTKYVGVLLVEIVTVLGAFGQVGPQPGTGGVIEFKAPMAFYAGDELLPAGKYEIDIKPSDLDVHNFSIISIDISSSDKILATIPYKTSVYSARLSKPEVIFNKYGDKAYLNAIKWPIGSDNEESRVLTVAPTASEQAAAKSTPAATYSVPASSVKKD